MFTPEQAIQAGKLIAESKLNLFYDSEQITVPLEGYTLIFHISHKNKQKKFSSVTVIEPDGKKGHKQL